MNMNDLPQELILEMFSYLPQNDLFKLYKTVSDLWTQISLTSKFWKNVDFDVVYGNHSLCFEHFQIIKHFVQSLVINEDQLSELFDKYHDNDIDLPNLGALDVSSVSAKQLADRIVNNCPHLVDLKISDGIRLDIHNCCEAFSKLHLISFDIHYYDSDTEKNRADLIRFIHSQGRLRKFGIRTFPYINETVKQIINEAQSLKSLYISECVSNEAFYGITKNLSLEELKIHSDRFSDEGLDFVTKKFAKKLKLLDVKWCTEITDSGISCVAKNCPHLEKLSMGNMFPKQHMYISSSSLNAISQGCPKLTYMSATGCIKIDDDGILSVVNCCKNLQILILKGCSEITDKSIYAISTCSALRKLDLTGCINISLTALIHLMNIHQKLKILILAFCHGIKCDNEKQKRSNSAKVIMKGKRRRISKTDVMPEYSSTTEKTTTFDRRSGSQIEEVSLKGSENMTITTVLTLVRYCPLITRLWLPNKTKMEKDEQFIRSLFSLCPYLNTFFIFGRTIERNRYIQSIN